MLVRTEAGGHKADLTISGCKGGSSRLPLLRRSFLEAILVSGTFSGMLTNPGVGKWDGSAEYQPFITGIY